MAALKSDIRELLYVRKFSSRSFIHSFRGSSSFCIPSKNGGQLLCPELHQEPQIDKF